MPVTKKDASGDAGALATVDGFELQMTDEKLEELSETVNRAAAIIEREDIGDMKKALTMASAMRRLRDMIPDGAVRDICEMQNTRLGFKTDRENGYPPSVVKDAVIEGMLHGIPPVMNRMNIIGGNFYCTREGYEYRLPQLVTDMVIDIGVAKVEGDRAIVPCKIRALPRETESNPTPSIVTIEKDIAMRVNRGQGDDAITGKAKRKIMALLYERITGSEMTDGDASEPQVVVEGQVVDDSKKNLESQIKNLVDRNMGAADREGDKKKPRPGTVTTPQLKKIHALGSKIGMEKDDYEAVVSALTKDRTRSMREISKEEAARLIEDLEEQIPE